MAASSSQHRFAMTGALAVLVATCGVAGAFAREMPRRDVTEERGYRIAARECAGCHAIELRGESPRPSAPPFREIRSRYNEISLRREFEAISQVGHYEMPAKPISTSDGQDLIRYIESLGR